jgi:hypothetical protein
MNILKRITAFIVATWLYETDIITYYPDGTFVADNGGFNTPTTSTRCNQFGPEGWCFFHHNKKLTGRNKSMDIEMGKREKVK